MTPTSIYCGDSATLSIPLAWGGADFEPGITWGLIFTAKLYDTDPDSSAAIQKASGVGITVSGSTASVEIVPDDTAALASCMLFWDVQAQNVDTGAVRTVAFGRLPLTRDITRETSTSVPINTTTDPAPFAGAITIADLESLAASDPEDFKAVLISLGCVLNA